MVHLVNHDIGRRAHRRTQVFLPPFGIGLAQIDDRGTVAVHSDGLCPDARRLGQPSPVIKYTERIEQPLAVSRQFGRPRAVGRSIHRPSQQRTAALARAVQPQANPLGRRRPQPERGALGRIGQLEVVAPVDGIAVVCRFVFHRKSVFHIIMRKERMSCPAAVRAESAGNLRQPLRRDPDRVRCRRNTTARRAFREDNESKTGQSIRFLPLSRVRPIRRRRLSFKPSVLNRPVFFVILENFC